ncbi:LysR family transcriptional regulator [Rhodococcus sp. NPDC059968]|uniref:LysR family transcriptional regulator n=1 Tax=Rhodococcus sp. NPDC059968 TaxID=3347017 RepID=UPI003672E844
MRGATNRHAYDRRSLRAPSVRRQGSSSPHVVPARNRSNSAVIRREIGQAMSTNVEVRHLRAFAATAEQLHFTRAAACLHITQQALSTQIRLLEKQLGIKLFDRTTRKVELTTAGGVLYKHVQSLFDQLDCAVEEARRSASLDRGPVRTPIHAQRDLPPSPGARTVSSHLVGDGSDVRATADLFAGSAIPERQIRPLLTHPAARAS